VGGEMRRVVDKERWYFVDEAGDLNFYAKGSRKVIVGTEGCSRVFLLGYFRVCDPQVVRAKLAEVRLAIFNDRYLQPIPSVKKSLVSFHAKDDCPEVRHLVYSALQTIDFRAQIIVARKREEHFREDFECSDDKLYDRTVTTLFGNQLHIAERNYIVFARRGTKTRQYALRDAVQTAVDRFRKKFSDATETEVSVVTSRPLQEPALQAADYILWAVQRAYEKREMRYFEAMREKIQLVKDIYDFGPLLRKILGHHRRGRGLPWPAFPRSQKKCSQEPSPLRSYRTRGHENHRPQNENRFLALRHRGRKGFDRRSEKNRIRSR
jgi:hypothetical protein